MRLLRLARARQSSRRRRPRRSALAYRASQGADPVRPCARRRFIRLLIAPRQLHSSWRSRHLLSQNKACSPTCSHPCALRSDAFHSIGMLPERRDGVAAPRGASSPHAADDGPKFQCRRHDRRHVWQEGRATAASKTSHRRGRRSVGGGDGRRGPDLLLPRGNARGALGQAGDRRGEAATWIFRGDAARPRRGYSVETRRRRGHDAPIPRGRVAASPAAAPLRNVPRRRRQRPSRARRPR